MNKVYFLPTKINEFPISPCHLFKLTLSLMGISKTSQYPNIPSHIIYTQFSYQLNGTNKNTLRSIAFNMTDVFLFSPIMI